MPKLSAQNTGYFVAAADVGKACYGAGTACPHTVTMNLTTASVANWGVLRFGVDIASNSARPWAFGDFVRFTVTLFDDRGQAVSTKTLLWLARIERSANGHVASDLDFNGKGDPGLQELDQTWRTFTGPVYGTPLKKNEIKAQISVEIKLTGDIRFDNAHVYNEGTLPY